MKENRITDHVIDDRRDREGEQDQEGKGSILEDLKRCHDRMNSQKLAPVIEELLPEDIGIIVEHISMIEYVGIKLIIPIKGDACDRECIWKWILTRSFDNTDEIWVEELITRIRLITRYRSDGDPREGRTKLFDQDSGLQTLDHIATLVVDRELDLRLHIRDEVLRNEENEDKDIHEKNQQSDHEDRWEREERIADDISEGVLEDAHSIAVSIS